jgi:SAM-dependent methyltransferase
VDAADEKLERDYPHLRECVSFHQVEPDYPVAEERFDLVISKDTFEHVDDPRAYVAAMKEYLKPGGEIAIGFGPLWKSPWGGHIDFMTRAPWAHLIFPEQVILAERRRFRPDEDPSRFEEIRGGLNRMTLARFVDTMEGSGLVKRYFATNRSEGARSRWRSAFLGTMRMGARVPALREYCTMNVYSVWAAR